MRALAPLVRNLTHLDLEKNCLTDAGMYVLASAARRMRHLQVTGARLTLQTAPLLCNAPRVRQTLRSLLVGGTGAMTSIEAKQVVESCDRLTRLYVWSQMTEDECAELQRYAQARSGRLSNEIVVLAKPRNTQNANIDAM